MKTEKQIECRYCEEGTMFVENYDEAVKHGRSSLLVAGLSHWRCNACLSVMTDIHQMESNIERVRSAERRAPGYVSPFMLREFREKYSLSQREASRLIGAGVSAFGKYESGETMSVPTAKLVRAALAIPAVVRMLAEEEGMNVTLPEDQTQWTEGKFPTVAHRVSVRCVNDAIYPPAREKLELKWKNAASAIAWN